MQSYNLKLSNPAVKRYSIKFFLYKLLALIILWKTSYNFVLKPVRIPDRFLTDIVTIAVTACINFFSSFTKATWFPDTLQPLNLIQQNGKTLLLIFDDCNGLDLIAIYIGFIILLPHSIKRKILYSIGGLFVIMIGNVVRCVSLYWIYIHHRSYFEFNHHYIFTIIMYLIIFCGWVLFTKKENTHAVC